MFDQAYPYRTANLSKFFTFESISEKRTVVKVVQFSQVWENVYNLGLADFEQGKLHFQETTNNHDIVRVLGTVAAIVRRFADLYPDREVFIQGDARRMKLYNLVLLRHWAEIEPDFWVWGLLDDEWALYVPGETYGAVKIKRKQK
jgi:hypothetical protein